MSSAPRSSTPEQLEEQMAIAFLERFHADREACFSSGRAPRPLAEYLAMFPGCEARIAQEWLSATAWIPSDSIPSPGSGEMPATDIGPFRLLRELGRGGQGIVYLAEDTRIGRKIALKVLRPDIAALAGEAALRFYREAEAIARLDHPGIATVFELGKAGSVSYVAMRYVPGGSLQDQISARTVERSGPPSARTEVRRVVRIVERAARALDAAHRAGILHRDLKPANILMAEPEVPVLVDFGLASYQAGSTPSITIPGSVLGTMGYLAPERLAGTVADICSDVYALGVVLFELLALQRPFQAATAGDELHAIAHASLPDIRRMNPAVEHDLAVVIATALARLPHERYQSASAFADDLGHVRRREPIAAKPPSTITRVLRFAQRESALTTLLILLVVVLSAGAASTTWLWRRERLALADVERLADLKLVREVDERAAGLWPARPENVDRMVAWIEMAEGLVKRRPGHVAALQRLPTKAEDRTVAWQREELEALTREVARVPSRIRAVRHRLTLATALVDRTLVKPARAWRAVHDRVRRSPRYAGLDLQPQLGLVPIGSDPVSGLEEFVHFASGSVAERGAHGKLEPSSATGIVLVLIPGGRAVLGADRDRRRDGRSSNLDRSAAAEWTPSYEIELAPFFLAKYEMTRAQWQRHELLRFGGVATESPPVAAATEARPVVMVSWEDCDRAARELDLSLPTEAQWEWAYRALGREPYPYGDDCRSLALHENLADRHARDHGGVAWRCLDWLDDGHVLQAPVGSFAPNAFGLHDMGGNVKEWCSDTWGQYREALPRSVDGLRTRTTVSERVVRGGSFKSTDVDPRSASRVGCDKSEKSVEMGLRLARGIER